MAVDLDPKAVTCDELFGIINPATREWKDGNGLWPQERAVGTSAWSPWASGLVTRLRAVTFTKSLPGEGQWDRSQAQSRERACEDMGHQAGREVQGEGARPGEGPAARWAGF